MNLKIDITKSVGAIVDRWAGKLTGSFAKEALRLANYAGGEIAKYCISSFKRGTGQLARSFLPARMVESSGGTAAGALSDLPYAWLVTGTTKTITPKEKKNLAIPLTPKAKTLWPRDWAKGYLACIQSKAGNLLLIGGHKSGVKGIPQYLLRPSVTITGKPVLEQAAAALKLRIAGDLPHQLAVDMTEGAGGD